MGVIFFAFHIIQIDCSLEGFVFGGVLLICLMLKRMEQYGDVVLSVLIHNMRLADVRKSHLDIKKREII